MIAFGLTYVPVVLMTYVSDSYLPVNADALMLVNGLKVSFCCTAAEQMLMRTEHCCFWLPLWYCAMGERVWACERIWHASRHLCCHYAFGNPSHRVRRAFTAHQCDVEDHTVIYRCIQIHHLSVRSTLGTSSHAPLRSCCIRLFLELHVLHSVAIPCTRFDASRCEMREAWQPRE